MLVLGADVRPEKANTTNPSNLTDAELCCNDSAGWADPVCLLQSKVINRWQCGLIFEGGIATSATSLATSPFILDGCEITGHGQIGVYAAPTADGAVTNCYIHSNGASGIEEAPAFGPVHRQNLRLQRCGRHRVRILLWRGDHREHLYR